MKTFRPVFNLDDNYVEMIPDKDGSWVNAEIAQQMYEALRDIRMSTAGSEQRKKGWDNALIALAKAEGKQQ